jgi:catechol 2,3-dioxygenase-like lactoylglutathione lyase family enzyme
MKISLHSSFLPHTDPDASLAFYRDVLGFEVLGDVGYEAMRWITVRPPGQTGAAIVLEPPAADPGVTDDERRVISEMMAKGTYSGVLLATDDLDAAFERVEAANAEVVQEPMDQDWGVRDFAVRDPSGNLIRVQENR